MSDTQQKQGPIAIFLIFLRLGLTSFGGPVAHLGYFREEFVARRKWLTEASFADLISLCQFLPGPASSQVGLSVGLIRGSYLGGLAAWAGFTLPSAFALILFALGIANYGDVLPAGVLHGLKVVAVAVVAKAVWGMATKLCTDASRITIMAVAACVVLAFPTALGQVGIIGVAAFVGMVLFKGKTVEDHQPLPLKFGRGASLMATILFFAFLLGLPFLVQMIDNQALARFDAFFRTGSLVFGGGHVVLPLIQAEVVPSGWVSHETFLAGYGATQAVPGPLFTFSAFLGASMTSVPNGFIGGMICLAGIYVPSFLLIMAALPHWEGLRRNPKMQKALSGVNAAVVGLLVAALYDPVWTAAIHKPQDFAFALVAFVALQFWKLAPWLVVLSSGIIGWLLTVVI